MKSKIQAKISMGLRLMQASLATMSPAVERKTPNPALGSVRIEPLDGAVELTTTNQKLSIRSRRKIAGTQAGAPMLLPALRLESHVRLLDGDSVSIEAVDSQKAAIQCGGTVARLPLLPVGTYPYVETRPAEDVVTLAQPQAARMLRHVAFAASKDGKQDSTRGALIEVADARVSMVATDGHRLARYSVRATALATKLLIPESLLGAMSKTANEGADGSCLLSVTESTVFASFEEDDHSVHLSHRIVAGQFPNYRAILPTKAEASIRVDSASVVAAVRRCINIADSASQLVTVSVAPTELTLSAAESSTGETVDRLKVTSAFTFPPLKVHFRGGYLMDALTRIQGDVTLSFARVGATMGLWLTHTPVDDECFEYVLMGMKTA